MEQARSDAGARAHAVCASGRFSAAHVAGKSDFNVSAQLQVQARIPVPFRSGDFLLPELLPVRAHRDAPLQRWLWIAGICKGDSRIARYTGFGWVRIRREGQAPPLRR